ncbi:MAG TPA: DUF1570 domain-containing protein [Rhodopirellula baltica]|uniref:DUF1570 domain-containing protein n=1 Tax=Rhodopirellula baltica (strain DSM 10527 / NCIMB 13988 / SH1) TaxID=243090 RepID=Q7UU86_RHOBA|nr:DUF1570 domain-containing protein [Rhodopirellula baltica]CAD73196.1 hypothetical protein RB3440 [Rhodopirellula baltica SH 1]HBE61819.1 DUF1570 domain-containing protein [Rhodopirellula baltica]
MLRGADGSDVFLRCSSPLTSIMSMTLTSIAKTSNVVPTGTPHRLLSYATRFRVVQTRLVPLVAAILLSGMSAEECNAEPVAPASPERSEHLVSSQSVAPSIRPGLVEFRVGNSWQSGLHLIESASESLVIGRDGWLHTISRTEKSESMRSIAGQFQPTSSVELRNRLRAEFGREFEVIATQNFLVVQPKGRGSRWPKMFEQCHRAFVTYMERRGVKVRQGRFPMVAVVLPDARAMYDEIARLGIDVSRVAGLYANKCNRVMTHDGGAISMIAATVRHEAAHQSAFNCGVHSRVNDTPSWVTEGIGQMFEPDAMSSGRSGTRLVERVNKDSVRQLRETIDMEDPAEVARWVDRMIRSDDLFRNPTTIHTAYALAWSMMFYLAERDTEAFADILNFTATRPPFETYKSGQRMIDFERVVGTDVRDFSNRLTRFVASLP